MNERKIDMDALKSILSDVTKPNQDHLVKEYQLAEHYDILLDHPTLLANLDLPQQHRILSKALLLNPEFPYSKFLDFILMTVDKNPDFSILLGNIDISNFDSQSLDKLASKISFNPKIFNQFDRLNDFINEQSQHMTNDLLNSFNEEIIQLKEINQQLNKEISELRTINDKLTTENQKKDVEISKLIKQNNELLGNLEKQSVAEQQTKQRISEDYTTQKQSQTNSQQNLEQPNCDFSEVRQLCEQILSNLETKENSYLEFLSKNENERLKYIKEQNLQILNEFEIIIQSLTAIQADNAKITQNQEESKEVNGKIQEQIQSFTTQFESIDLPSNFDTLIESQANLCGAINDIKVLIEKPINKNDPAITDFNRSIQMKIDESTKTLSSLLNQSQVESLSMSSTSNIMPVKGQEMVLSTSYLTFIQSEFSKMTELVSRQKRFIDKLNAELINSRKQIAKYKAECTQFVYTIRDQYKEKLSSEKTKMSQQLQKEYQAKYDKALQEQKCKQQAQQLNDITIDFQAEVTNIMNSLKASLDYLINHDKNSVSEELRLSNNRIIELRNENSKLKANLNAVDIEKTQFESKLISILTKRQNDLSIIEEALEKKPIEARMVYIAAQIQGYKMFKGLENQIKQKDAEIDTLKKTLKENVNANKLIQELQTILGISFSETAFRDIWKNFRSKFEKYESLQKPTTSTS